MVNKAILHILLALIPHCATYSQTSLIENVKFHNITFEHGSSMLNNVSERCTFHTSKVSMERENKWAQMGQEVLAYLEDAR